jgi:hypothetical protein
MIKLKPCKCGKEVEIKYMAGISPSLAKIAGIVNSTPYPRYYIMCSCGRCCETRVNGITEQQRDRQKNILIRAWNNEVEG